MEQRRGGRAEQSKSPKKPPPENLSPVTLKDLRKQLSSTNSPQASPRIVEPAAAEEDDQQVSAASKVARLKKAQSQLAAMVKKDEEDELNDSKESVTEAQL